MTTIANAFAECDERSFIEIDRVFVTLLKRHADGNAASLFLQQMHAGMTDEALIACVMGSQEYLLAQLA